MRAVWVVGSNRGWPLEVYVLFSTAREARRHADLSTYEFDVFPLPVYDRYEDIPMGLRLDSPANVPNMRTMASDESDLARMVAESEMATVEQLPPAPVHAVGAWEQQGVPEVWVLYERPEEAERHAGAAYYMVETRTLPVFARYADCPQDQRYTSGGSASSQLVRRRDA